MLSFKIISVSLDIVETSVLARALADPVMPIPTAIEILCNPYVSTEEAAKCISQLPLKRAIQILSHSDMSIGKAAEILSNDLIPYGRKLDIFISKDYEG